MSINTDFLVRNILELNAAFRWIDAKAIDTKIQEVIKQLEIFKPHAAACISQIYAKTNINTPNGGTTGKERWAERLQRVKKTVNLKREIFW